MVDLAVAEPWEIIRLRATEIGYVSQFFSVIPRVSAIDILTNTQTARGIPSKSARRIPGESGNLSPTLGHVSRHLQRR